MSSQKGKRKDESGQNGPKRPMQQRVINNFYELELSPEQRSLPEFQTDETLIKLMEEYTYKDMVQAAFVGPMFLQRFFGIMPPPTKIEANVPVEFEARSYVLADKLLFPYAFQILLRKDFGIAYEPDECSAKTPELRELVSRSLQRYAQRASEYQGVSKLSQLTKLRELYVWLRSVGEKKTETFDRETEPINLEGDGIVTVVTETKGRVQASIVDVFLWIVGRVGSGRFFDRTISPTYDSGLSDIEVKKDKNASIVDDFGWLNPSVVFRREEDAYFAAVFESYIGNPSPVGMFKYHTETNEAELIMCLSQQLFARIAGRWVRFFPGYCFIASQDGICVISEKPEMSSFYIPTGPRYTLAAHVYREEVVMKYIDDNGNISPRVVASFGHIGLCIFIVIDFPSNREPVVKQYQFAGFEPRSIILVQENFTRVFPKNGGRALIFDPASGKLAVHHGEFVMRVQGVPYTKFVKADIVPIAFDFQNKDTVIGEVRKASNIEFFRVRELDVKRQGKFVINIDGR